MLELKIIGKRIRDERKARGLTLQNLSQKTGLSIPYLSQIENSRVNMSINTLENISQALEVALVSLMVEDEPIDVSLVRRTDRRWFALGDQAVESLLVKARSNMEICVIRLNEGSDTVEESSHAGEEFSFVLTGSVKLVLGEKDVYVLNEGDVIYYRSALSHFWKNVGEGVAEVLVVNTPATY